MRKEFGIRFGAISDPIAKQLREQKLKFDKKEVEYFQKWADCINHLRIGLGAPDSAISIIERKLYKRIESHILKENKLTLVKK